MKLLLIANIVLCAGNLYITLRNRKENELTNRELQYQYYELDKKIEGEFDEIHSAISQNSKELVENLREVIEENEEFTEADREELKNHITNEMERMYHKITFTPLKVMR